MSHSVTSTTFYRFSDSLRSAQGTKKALADLWPKTSERVLDRGTIWWFRFEEHSACLPSKGTLNYPGAFVTQCILGTVAVVSSCWPYFGEKIFSLSQVLMSNISDRNSSQQMLPNLGIQKATLGQATLLRDRQGWGHTFILLRFWN